MPSVALSLDLIGAALLRYDSHVNAVLTGVTIRSLAMPPVFLETLGGCGNFGLSVANLCSRGDRMFEKAAALL